MHEEKTSLNFSFEDNRLYKPREIRKTRYHPQVNTLELAHAKLLEEKHKHQEQERQRKEKDEQFKFIKVMNKIRRDQNFTRIALTDENIRELISKPSHQIDGENGNHIDVLSQAIENIETDPDLVNATLQHFEEQIVMEREKLRRQQKQEAKKRKWLYLEIATAPLWGWAAALWDLGVYCRKSCN